MRRRRPRELFGPLAKWGHPINHHHTYTHRQLDRAVDLLETIRNLLTDIRGQLADRFADDPVI